jgi:hypothetical protein
MWCESGRDRAQARLLEALLNRAGEQPQTHSIRVEGGQCCQPVGSGREILKGFGVE